MPAAGPIPKPWPLNPEETNKPGREVSGEITGIGIRSGVHHATPALSRTNAGKLGIGRDQPGDAALDKIGVRTRIERTDAFERRDAIRFPAGDRFRPLEELPAEGKVRPFRLV